MKSQAQGWLDSAADDLLVVEEIIKNDQLTHMVAFHSEQAIEKCFKALFEENELSVPRVHDLMMLHSRVERYITLDIDMELLKQISELYIDARYPSDLGLLPEGKPPSEVAEQMYELAKKIHQSIRKMGA